MADDLVSGGIMKIYVAINNWIMTHGLDSNSSGDKPSGSQDQGTGVADDKPKNASTSPNITPDDLKGKTREQIDQGAKDKGLVPDPKKPNKYHDPVTGKERVRVDPGHGNRQAVQQPQCRWTPRAWIR